MDIEMTSDYKSTSPDCDSADYKYLACLTRGSGKVC